MKLLAFETSTEACSVALMIDGDVRERFDVAPRRHAELALPWADALLAEAGVSRASLDAIACSRGPGAFTGVRLGIALAQGIALALDLPVLPVSSLAALARRASADARVLAALDARMDEVYLAAFDVSSDDARVALGDEMLVDPRRATVGDGRWFGIGTGFAALDGALAARVGDALAGIDAAALPHAADVAALAAHSFARGEALAPERVEPAYLRDKVARTLAERAARTGE